MLRLLALSLGLPPEYFYQYFTSPMVALRPLHYSAEVGLAVHGEPAASVRQLWIELTEATVLLNIRMCGFVVAPCHSLLLANCMPLC